MTHKERQRRLTIIRILLSEGQTWRQIAQTLTMLGFPELSHQAWHQWFIRWDARDPLS